MKRRFSFREPTLKRTQTPVQNSIWKLPWKVGMDSSFAGYPAILKTEYRISGGCRIPDISMSVRYSKELLKELKRLKSSNKSKNVILISGLPDIRPDIRKPDIRFLISGIRPDTG